MSQEYVDIALLEVERASGSLVRLNDVIDFSLDITDNTSAVKTMNRRRRARGYRRGVDEFTGSLTVAKRVVPELEWRTIFRNKEILQVYYDEAEDGRRFHLRDFRVTDVGTEAGEDGESNLKITFMALDEIEVPA